MARHLFPLVDVLIGTPASGPRLGASALLTHSTRIDLFTDRACTNPAACVGLAVDRSPDEASSTSYVVVVGVSIPEFYGPNDDTTELFGRPNGASGEGFSILARDALGGSGVAELDYLNAAPGSRFTMLYNGTTGFVDPATGAVATARPATAPYVYFDYVGGGTGVSDPSWGIYGDRRVLLP